MPLFEEYAHMGQIFSVSALTELIRNELEKSFPFVWVRGEVTDYSISSNGHMYFGLKDGNSLLQCIWFAGSRRRAAGQTFDPLTGEVFEEPRPDLERLLRNGLELVCAGGINLYAKSGRYQLVVEHAELSGQGALALELEQRKARYAAAGYFSLERKRPLPANPARIALITSPRGAAIHDFLKLAATRGLSSAIRLFPVTVQGKGAAAKMAQAIGEANRQNWAELVVLIRGGGSAEDLMEFNEPELVEAIFASRLPVLAGIGHEVDVFLSDLTADVRAATPSHAAQILWPLRTDIWQKLDDLESGLNKRINALLEGLEDALAQRSRALGWLSPQKKIERLRDRRQQLEQIMEGAIRNLLDRKDFGISRIAMRLRQAGMLESRLGMADEKLKWKSRLGFFAMEKLLQKLSGVVSNRSESLADTFRQLLLEKTSETDRLALLLENRNPLLPLQKGYALLSGADGIVNSVRDCQAGEHLRARLLDGSLELTVTAVHQNQNKDLAYD